MPSRFLLSIFFVKGIYPGFWLTYIGFAFYPILGKFAEKSLRKQVVFLPAASFLFFAFSNLGVWWYWYDHTFAKLLICFAAAVPFYARTLASDLAFGYSFLVLKHRGQIRVFTQKHLLAVLQKMRLPLAPAQA
jgi:hypothetical protein